MKVQNLAALAAVVVAMCVLPVTAHAATFTVTKVADTADGTCDADCSLREAIVAANAAGGTNDITLPAGTYNMTLSGMGGDVIGDFNLGPITLTINGAGAASTIIDGQAADRIFETTGTALTLNDLTLQNGSFAGNGGALYQQGMGTITLDHVVVTDNHATGMTGNGGGISLSTGTLVVKDSTFSGNSAGGAGGGLYTSGPSTTIDRTLIHDNSADTAGGIQVTNTNVIRNTTIVGNSAVDSYGGASLGGTSTLSNVTMFGNQADSDEDGSGDVGGFSTMATPLTISNSIFADNVDLNGAGASTDANCAVTGGTQTIDARNLWDNTTGCPTAHASDLVNVEPSLSTLDNYGGPTKSMLPTLGSPAIDAGLQATCAAYAEAFDQRGLMRTVSTCDIGATEMGALADVGAASSIATRDIGNPAIAWTATLTNNGTEPVLAPTLTLTLPSGVTGVTTSSSEVTCTATYSSCARASLNPAESMSVTVMVSATTSGMPAFSATASHAGIDPNSANDATSQTTTFTAVKPAITLVVPRKGLKVKKGAFTVTLKCPIYVVGGCKTALTVTTIKKYPKGRKKVKFKLACTPTTITAGATTKVRCKMTKPWRAMFTKRRPVKVVLAASATSTAGTKASASKKTRLY